MQKPNMFAFRNECRERSKVVEMERVKRFGNFVNIIHFGQFSRPRFFGIILSLIVRTVLQVPFRASI